MREEMRWSLDQSYSKTTQVLQRGNTGYISLCLSQPLWSAATVNFKTGCLTCPRPCPCQWCGCTVAALTITLPWCFQWAECLLSLADLSYVDILHKQITSLVHLLITSLFSPFCCKSHSLSGLHWFNLYQIANAVIRHAWPPVCACFPHYAYAFTSNYSK